MFITNDLFWVNIDLANGFLLESTKTSSKLIVTNHPCGLVHSTEDNFTGNVRGIYIWYGQLDMGSEIINLGLQTYIQGQMSYYMDFSLYGKRTS